MLQVSGLFIYPIKSLAGIAVNSAIVTDRGFKYDRRWMLVNANNQFITQRELPAIALLTVALEDAAMRVTDITSGSFIMVPYSPVNNNPCQVIVWDDTCEAIYVSDEADEWFMSILGIKCRLVYMPDESRRQVDEEHAAAGNVTSFSDAYPFMIIGQASLNDLNNRLKEPLPVNRFRPNIVFTGGQPFEEDTMDNFTIGGINFYGVKLCARCIVTTINQANAAKTKEPLKTLATYRSKNKNVYFGQNLIHKGQGIIAVGDALQVISKHKNNEKFIITPSLTQYMIGLVKMFMYI
jgi:uncharacterized protein YcbX